MKLSANNIIFPIILILTLAEIPVLIKDEHDLMNELLIIFVYLKRTNIVRELENLLNLIN